MTQLIILSHIVFLFNFDNKIQYIYTYMSSSTFAGGGSWVVCRHMQRKTSQAESLYFNRQFAIQGHLVHLKPSQKTELLWFVYLLEDRGCKLQYVCSMYDVCSKWANTKSACNEQKSKTTGLTSHFMEGCHSDTGPGKDNIRPNLSGFHGHHS